MKTRIKFYDIAKLLATIFVISCICSCQKILDAPVPANEILVKNSFNDSTSATGAVAGIYSKMCSNSFFEWGGITKYASEGADETNNVSPMTDFQANTLTSLNFDMPHIWSNPYATMLAINTAIEGLSATTALNANLKKRLLGECYFDRAFINFYLVNFWGDAAALTTTSILTVNAVAPSTPTATMYAQIISDLKLAQSMMTNVYPSSGPIRPNAMAATALLARVYLYTKQYSDAVTQANSVTNSGLYALPALNSVFLVASTEAIWSLKPSPSPSPTLGVPPDGNLFVPLTAVSFPSFVASDQLLAAFEPGDQRKANWIKTSNVFVVTDTSFNILSFTYPYKYKSTLLTGKGTENYVVLRLAEQYLIRAEAETDLGDVADAVTDLNVIRSRAGLPGLSSALSQTACMAAVQQEWRVEFFAEWGHRWLDLKRWPATDGSSATLADQVLPAIKPKWKPFQKLYPLPKAELQFDPFLKQNLGY
jgi:starch-binding outer membrane protein, SusD/RagB family